MGVLFGTGVLTAAGCAGYKIYEDQVARSLEKSAARINDHMIRVTRELEKQCTAIEKVVSKLECASGSTEKIAALINAWSQEGATRKSWESTKFRSWLEESLPRDVSELSGYC